MTIVKREILMAPASLSTPPTEGQGTEPFIADYVHKTTRSRSERADGTVDDRETGLQVDVRVFRRRVRNLAGALQGASQQRIVCDGLGRLGRIHACTTRMCTYLLISPTTEG